MTERSQAHKSAQDTCKQDRRQAYARSTTKRPLLRTLWASRHQFLVRSEIHKRLNPVNRPTAGRVGQILAEFQREGLLDCRYGPTQGKAEAAHYALSDEGQDLCRAMGLDRDERDLFPVNDEMMMQFLVPERLCAPATATPGHVTTFHSHRGGLGRSMMVAYSARLIATHLNEADLPILVTDFALDAPGLDEYFAPAGLGSCRGFRGLVLDYYDVPPRRRSIWLRGALVEPGRYVLLPAPDLPQLLYLPSGFAPGIMAQYQGERSAALARLWEEAGFSSDEQFESSGNVTTNGGFLNDLSAALRDLFSRTIIDSHTGISLGAWAATSVLADELVLCARLSDKDADGIRVVLTNFLRMQTSRKRQASVAFIIAPRRATVSPEALTTWIENHIISKKQSELTNRDSHFDRSTYRAVALKYIPYLEDGHAGWRGDAAYKHVVDMLQMEDLSIPQRYGERNVPISIQLLINEVSDKIVVTENNEGCIIRGAVASSLGDRNLAAQIGINSYAKEIDDELLELAKRTQKVMNMPSVKTYR